MKKRFLALFFASILILGCVGNVFAADKQIMNLSELVWEEIDDDQVEVMKRMKGETYEVQEAF